jgi:hypothetical protein
MRHLIGQAHRPSDVDVIGLALPGRLSQITPSKHPDPHRTPACFPCSGVHQYAVWGLALIKAHEHGHKRLIIKRRGQPTPPNKKRPAQTPFFLPVHHVSILLAARTAQMQLMP